MLPILNTENTSHLFLFLTFKILLVRSLNIAGVGLKEEPGSRTGAAAFTSTPSRVSTTPPNLPEQKTLN